jgi:hypothetical protein
MGLRRRMFEINAKNGSFIKFFDISSYEEKGKLVWIAWYYVDLEDIKDLESGGNDEQA